MPGVTPPTQTWIAVYPPHPDWVVPQELSLEVGDEASQIDARGGWGATSPTLAAVTSVRLFGAEDCHSYAAFEAAPGGFYIIRFAEDASTSVEQVIGMDSGPGLPERGAGLTGCE